MKSRDALFMATACLISFTILAIAKTDPQYIEVPEFGFLLVLGYLLGRRAKSSPSKRSVEKYANKVIDNAVVPSVTELISEACDRKKGKKKRGRT
ncbi:MAG: hypothetical protein QXR44_05580 [Thermoproteota archaeon]